MFGHSGLSRDTRGSRSNDRNPISSPTVSLPRPNQGFSFASYSPRRLRLPRQNQQTSNGRVLFSSLTESTDSHNTDESLGEITVQPQIESPTHATLSIDADGHKPHLASEGINHQPDIPILAQSNDSRSVKIDALDGDADGSKVAGPSKPRRISLYRRSPKVFVSVKEMREWMQIIQTKIHDLKETSILYTVGPAAPSPAASDQSNAARLRKVLMVFRALSSTVDVFLHLAIAVQFLADKHYDWFPIALAIVLFRTLVTAIVSKSVARVSPWYRVMILFQLNFLYDGYISVKSGNLTPLFQVGKFIKAIIESLPFSLLILCFAFEEGSWSPLCLVSLSISVISSTLSAWEVSCRDAPSYNHGARNLGALLYRFTEVAVFVTGASLWAHFYGPLLVLVFLLKWAVMGFVSLSRFQERNANTALSVVYGLSILDVAVIFTSAMLPGRNRPSSDVEYFMVADSSVGSFGQALIASDMVSAVVVGLLIFGPADGYLGNSYDQITITFDVLFAALIAQHIMYLILAVFNAKETRTIEMSILNSSQGEAENESHQPVETKP